MNRLALIAKHFQATPGSTRDALFCAQHVNLHGLYHP